MTNFPIRLCTMMDRNLNLSSHDHHQQGQHQQHYDPQPSPLQRSQFSRPASYSAPTQNPYTQTNDNVSNTMPLTHQKDDQSAYIGLGITTQSTDNVQSLLLPSPDSPFTTHPMMSRYGTGQPPTPSFPTLRSSSPASSVWSASDHGTSSNLSGFIPRLHKYVLLDMN